MKFIRLPDESKALNRWMVNDLMWLNIDPLMVKKGKPYWIAFHKGMNDGHPFHLHRHGVEVTSIAGKSTAGIIKDTINVAKNGTVEMGFVTNNSGPSLDHCHMSATEGLRILWP